MKKNVKILTTFVMIVLIICTLGNFVLSLDDAIAAMQDPDVGDADVITDFGKRIVGIIQVIGIVVAVVVILVIGIKYLIGSAEQRAEYKKTMIPYLVGAVLVFAGTTIVNIIYNIVNSNIGDGGSSGNSGSSGNW